MNVTYQPHKLSCNDCGTVHRKGELFCTFCGKTLSIKNETKPNCSPSFTDILSAAESKSSSLSADKPLRIHLIDDDTTLIIKPKAGVVLGRCTLLGRSSRRIDIDLIPFGGFTRGVSQVHVIIRREADAVYIIDQDSKNGTFLNGIQLIPHERVAIQDGDLAHLGNLPIRFDFS